MKNAGSIIYLLLVIVGVVTGVYTLVALNRAPEEAPLSEEDAKVREEVKQMRADYDSKRCRGKHSCFAPCMAACPREVAERYKTTRVVGLREERELVVDKRMALEACQYACELNANAPF
jgi:hypothetical protein